MTDSEIQQLREIAVAGHEVKLGNQELRAFLATIDELTAEFDLAVTANASNEATMRSVEQRAQIRGEALARIQATMHTLGGPANRDPKGNWVCWPEWEQRMLYLCEQGLAGQPIDVAGPAEWPVKTSHLKGPEPTPEPLSPTVAITILARAVMALCRSNPGDAWQHMRQLGEIGQEVR